MSSSLEKGQTSREKYTRQEMIDARSPNLLTISYINESFVSRFVPSHTQFEIDRWNSELAYQELNISLPVDVLLGRVQSILRSLML